MVNLPTPIEITDGFRLTVEGAPMELIRELVSSLCVRGIPLREDPELIADVLGALRDGDLAYFCTWQPEAQAPLGIEIDLAEAVVFHSLGDEAQPIDYDGSDAQEALELAGKAYQARMLVPWYNYATGRYQVVLRSKRDDFEGHLAIDPDDAVALVALLGAIYDGANADERPVRDARAVAASSIVARYRDAAGLSLDSVAAAMESPVDELAAWETGSLPSRADCLGWLDALKLVQREQTPVSKLTDRAQLLRVLAANPSQMSLLDADAFQNVVAGLLEFAGWKVESVGNANTPDGGIDLLAVPRNSLLTPLVIAVQAKRSGIGPNNDGAKVGAPKVREFAFHAGRDYQRGLFVTNSGFTKDAWDLLKDEQTRGFLQLVDGDGLANWLRGDYTPTRAWSLVPQHYDGGRTSISVPRPDDVESSA